MSNAVTLPKKFHCYGCRSFCWRADGTFTTNGYPNLSMETYSYLYGWCSSTGVGFFFERIRMFKLSTPTENAIAK